MIYKLIESQQMILEDPSRHFLKDCLIMDKYLSAVNYENHQVLIDIHSVVGYCNYEGHPGVMTVTDYKTHHCANKKCPMFQPYKTFPYWKKHKSELTNFYSGSSKKAFDEREKQRRIREEKEKHKRQVAKEMELKKQKEQLAQQEHIKALKLYIELLFGETSTYEMYVAKIEYLGKQRYKVFLVSKYDDYYDMSFLSYVIENLKRAYPGKYTFQRMKSPYGNYATLYEWEHRKKVMKGMAV